MKFSGKEDDLILTVQAIGNYPALSIRAAAKMYSVPYTTLTMHL